MRTLFIVPWPRGADPVGRGLGERAEAHVGDALAHLDVAGADRGRQAARATSVPGGRDDVHRAQRAAVGRDGRVDRRCAARTRPRDTVTASTALTLPRALRVGAGEVEGDLVAGDRDGHDDPRRALLVGRGAGGVEHVLEAPAAVGQRGQHGPHPPLAVGDHLVERLRSASASEALDADHVGADLRVEVAGPLLGGARAGEQQRRAAPSV